MSVDDCENKKLLPHHVQQSLCTTRLPYRQGRKLTACKVYTVTEESNHLLVFGVPSIDIRQETRALFIKFGKLKFNIVKEYQKEQFTETFHAHFEDIKAARLAKRMLDGKNFYGGSLHICYAPELETVGETKEKLLQRKMDVLNRLKNLKRDSETKIKDAKLEKTPNSNQNEICNEVILKPVLRPEKLNMGYKNVIYVNKNKRKAKEKSHSAKVVKTDVEGSNDKVVKIDTMSSKDKVDVVDCTSTEREVISNINEALNYNKFGNEDVRRVDYRPLNKIHFFSNSNKKNS